MDQDIDMDDYDVDPEIARLQAEADAINAVRLLPFKRRNRKRLTQVNSAPTPLTWRQ